LSEYEADDVIGTLARKAEGRGLSTIIVSEDKDLLQLVTDSVKVLTERTRKQLYDRGEVERKLGVQPERVPDLLGLMGDSSDDIPGVPQIGEKRARSLLEQFGTVEEAIEHADEFDRYVWGRNLAEYAEQAKLSKELATVHTDLPLDLDLEGMAVAEPDRSAAREIFQELEFTRLLEDFVEEPEEAPGEYRTLGSPEELDEAVASIRERGRLALLVQGDHGEPTRARIVGLGLAWRPGSAVYLPVGHEGLTATNAMQPEEALQRLRPLLEEGIELTGHDLKHALVILGRHGVDDVRPDFDTMLASYVLHPTRQSHDLDRLAVDFLGTRLTDLADILPDRKATFAEVPDAEARRYACERAAVAVGLHDVFDPELESQPDLASLFRTIEMPLLSVLAAMERRGVRIDVDYLREMSEELGGELDEISAAIYEEAGGPFNLNSPKQLAEVLFDELELPVGGRTGTGKRSTRAEVLESLAEEHEIARRILEYRELSKLKSTYLDALPERVHPETGRVHASFDQAVAATGRLSSSNPNLQNIPVRTALGRRIRRAFVPADGHVLMTADYSQVELRIMAHLSGDENLRRAFRDREDIHRRTAAEIFDVPAEEVTHEQRDRAKVINFGVLYGMGPQRLAREFGITTKEARAFIDRYLSAYPGVQEFLERTVEEAKDRGYVTTLLGRIRHLPELQSNRPMIRSFGERVAVNTPIQGTAADLIKLAMVNLDRRLRAEGSGAAMLIQVHDELVLEVPEEEVESAAPLVRGEMEHAVELEVPLVVDIGHGSNWMDAK
ncbi:MAG: DNA polymerase I, partial [Acidobacteriota bacterium]